MYVERRLITSISKLKHARGVRECELPFYYNL